MQEKVDNIYIWWFFILSLLFYCLDFYFRLSPGLVLDQLREQYVTSASGIGTMISFFYLGYLVMQIPAGIILDKYSIKNIFIISIVIACLFFILFTLSSSLVEGLFFRFVIGLASAVAFIGTLHYARVFLSKKFFSLIAGLVISLGCLSASIVQISIAHYIKEYSWHTVFIFMGILGLFLALMMKSIPGGIFFVKKNQGEMGQVKFENFYREVKAFFANKDYVLGSVLGGLFYFPTLIFTVSWGMKFLKMHYGLSGYQSSIAISYVYLGWALMSPIIGWFARSKKTCLVLCIIFSFFAAVISLIILFANTLSVISIYFLLLLFGLFSSAQVSIWGIFNLAAVKVKALDVALINMTIIAIQSVAESLSGFLIDLQAKNINFLAHFHYTQYNYRSALLLMPIALIAVCLISLLWLCLKDKKQNLF